MQGVFILSPLVCDDPQHVERRMLPGILSNDLAINSLGTSRFPD